MLSRKHLSFLVRGMVLALLCLGLFISPTHAESCTPGSVCSFPTPDDYNYRYNMIRLLTVKGNSWSIPSGATVSFNEHFGDFSAKEGYLYASGIIGGGACDVASIMNYVFSLNGITTYATNPTHPTVLGVPDEYGITIFDYNGQGPSGKDLLITNQTSSDISLRWYIDGTTIKMWLENGSVVSDAKSDNTILFTIEGGIAQEKTSASFFDQLALFSVRNQSLLLIVFLLLTVIFLGKMVISRHFRELVAAGIVVGFMLAVAFVGLKPALAQSSVFAPPREANLVIPIPDETLTFSLNSSQSPSDNIACTLPQSYPQSILQWCDYIEQYAVETGLDPRLIAAVMLQESGGNPRAYSSAGATGLLQVMPRDGLAAKYTNANGVPYFSNRPSMEQLYDPEFNISYGTHMLAGLIAKFGSEREALLHYGPADVGYYYADIVINIREKYQ